METPYALQTFVMLLVIVSVANETTLMWQYGASDTYAYAIVGWDKMVVVDNEVEETDVEETKVEESRVVERDVEETEVEDTEVEAVVETSVVLNASIVLTFRSTLPVIVCGSPVDVSV